MSLKKSLFAVSLSFLVIMSQAGCGSGGGSNPSAGSALVGGSDSGSAAGTSPASGTTATGGAVPPATGGTGTTSGATTGGTGVAKLSWNPTADGAKGFKLHYGTVPGSYSTTIDVGMAPSYSLSGLPAGTYYFVVTAYDAAGNESAPSNEVSKTIS
jgi:hypothetical protein